jgi:hypothetical protein
MATLDKLSQAKSGKSKKDTGLAGAVASTEKIRHWVSFFSSFLTICP